MKLGRLIALALVAQLLAAPAKLDILVLCVGSDGHVAVESAGASLCCREWRTAHRENPEDGFATAIEPASEPCCNDVELSVEPARLTAPSPKPGPAFALTCRTPVQGSPLRAVPAGALPLPAESSVAASLRTVVLQA